MKQTIILFHCMLGLSFLIDAQILTKTPFVKKIDPAKAQIIKGMNEYTLVEKLPDLKIVSFNVSYLTGSGIEIFYTIKNDGTAPLSKSSVSLQGRIGFGPNDTRPFAGCGSGLGLSYEFLNPGESASGSYRCTGINRSPNLVYTLYLDISNEVKELNENNNSAQSTIL